MRAGSLAALGLAVVIGAGAPRLAAEDADRTSLPTYLKDRGTGVATSLAGTYVRGGELIIYPFFEYYRADYFEYKPEEFGFAGSEDFRGSYRANEGLLFFAYGLTDNLAVELEAAAIKAWLDKAPADPSAMPARTLESGLGDVEAEIRWRWRTETDRRPELFSYGEVVFPHSQDKLLIGTPGVELKLGTGVTRGFKWGTLTLRASVEYAQASTSHFDLGEYAIEYLKRVSPAWRFYVGIEGEQDEVSLIVEAQWHLSRYAFIKLDTGVGLTSKATDWAPEIGIVFTLPTRRGVAEARSDISGARFRRVN